MAETMALGIPAPTPSPNQLQTTTPLGVNGFVIDDAKRVEIITDRGEAAHRSRPGYAHRQDIRTDKLGTTDSFNITNLADQLYEARAVFGPGREIWFIPRASFDEILTPEVIVQVVNQLACYQNMNPDERIQVASDIYYGKDPSSGGPRPPCRKLLATLIGARADGTSLETVEEIKTHMDEGMNDDCLPLFFDGDNQLKCRLHGQNHPFINRPKRGRGQWKESFVRWSRALTAPYVLWDEAPESRHRHYVMLDGGPLPMAPVWEESVPHVHHGGFGDVLRVKIQIGDRNFQGPRGEDSFFALKKLKENGDAARVEFDLEVRSLIFTENRTNNVPGPNDTETKKHVIQLLASFEVYDSNLKHPTYYLLFPWADGNLEEFWRRHDKKYSPRDQGQISWTIDQFYHLAKALQCLHNDRQVNLSQRTDSNRYGRHGDIKPGNFLFFRDSDGVGVNLVLADFGLGRLHSKASKSKQSPNVPKTATYAAPEYEIDGGRLSPRSDIFSLGCVLLEHMVWFFHGHSAVEAFADERMAVDHYGFESDAFWKASDPEGKSAEIKDTVSKRLAALKKRDDCVEVIGEILEVIEKKMLQVRPEDRCTSLNLVLELDRIRRHWARRDSDYGSGAMPDHDLAESASEDSGRDSVTNPGYAESLFSRASAAPSLTSLGSTLGDIVQSAKVEMVAFFLADAELQPLLAAAIKDPSIGGDRLERNFRRLLADYSTNILETPDIKRIYTDAARLLRSEVLFISQEIRRELEPLPIEPSTISFEPLPNDERFEKGGPMIGRFLAAEAAVEAGPEPYDGSHSKAEPEQEEHSRLPTGPVETDNEEAIILSALDEIKEFLSSGTHMDNLRTGLRNFVTPRIEQPEDKSVAKLDAERPREVESTQIVLESESSVQGVPAPTFTRSLPDLVDYLYDLLPLPYWEPPVPPGKGRVRWKCKCGANLYDDFVELKPGSLKELETELRTTNNRDSQSGHKHAWSVTEIWPALYSLMTRMGNSLRRGSPNDDIALLPIQNTPGPHQTNNPATSEVYIHYLLCCMHIGGTGTKLHQERISRKLKDRELGILLNEVYRKRRNMLSWLNLRHVSKLHLTRFDVDFSSLVQVHLHKACNSEKCICLPTLYRIENGEYCCQPAPETSPAMVPVIGENRLMHLFQHPDDYKEEQEWIFNQLPKRSRGQLMAPHDGRELGWGLYFEEGWHWKSICSLVVLIIAGSLLFAILWTMLKDDLEGGFSVGSWMLAAGAVFLASMAFRKSL